MRTLLRRWWYGEEDRIALDLQDHRLVLAGASGRGDSHHLIEVLPEEVVGEVIRDGRVIDIGSLSALIRRSLPTSETRHARLGVSLPGRAVLCVALPSDLRFPRLKEDAVWDWMFERFSLSRDEYLITVVPSSGHGDPQNGIVMAARRVVITSWRECARRLGCELVFIAPRACVLIDDDECGYTYTPTAKKAVYVDLLDAAPSIHLYHGVNLVRTETLSEAIYDDAAYFLRSIRERLCKESSPPAGPLRVRVLMEKNEKVLSLFQGEREARKTDTEIEWIIDVTMPARKLLQILGARTR